MDPLTTTTQDGHELLGETRGEPRGDGDGGATVVLLHAGVADRRSFHEMAAPVAAAGNRVVAYDRRGFGETAPSEEPFTHVDDLREVLDHVAPGQVAWLVGSSMGGGLAIDAALTMPERVAGLVLFAPAVSGIDERAFAGFEYDDATRELEGEFMQAAEAGDLERKVELDLELWLDGPTARGRVQGPVRDLARDMATIVMHSEMSDEDGASGVAAWKRLAEITAPTTVVWGDLDVADGRIIVDEILERVPGAQLVELAGVAHLPYLEQPGRCGEVVLGALARHAVASS